MLRRALLSTLSLALVSSLAAAQAPTITPAGDPSVDPDTIYRLAVTAADFPEESYVLLLDDGVARFEADGRWTRTYRQIVQILRPDATDAFREREFSYAPKHQRFTLNWMRVVKPDGTVISAKPTFVQESDVPAELGDPTYSDRKVVRTSLSGVEPGTIVDYSFTTEELKPFLPGDFLDSWRVTPTTQVKRSRYIADVPTGLTPRIDEQNLNFKRVEHTANGRHSYTWATHDLPRIKGEMFASDSNGVMMDVVISSPTTWARIGKWYADSARSRYVLTPAVEAKIAEQVKGARTLDDSIRAVHRWVAQDIRYVAIALGMGGYQPRAPDDVVRTGFGDCKDKATLFVTALQHFGVTAYPVILSSTGHVRRDTPSISQLDHVIAAFQRPGTKGYQFADLTASMTPLGELPFGYQGDFGLVVHRDGTSEEITFPRSPLLANETDRTIVGTLSPAGIFDGRYVETDLGGRQYQLRNAFANPLDSTQRAKGAKAMASALFDGATGDSLVTFTGKDLAATPRVSILVRGGHAASMAGNDAILTNPFGPMSGVATLAQDLASAGPRRFPIDAQDIFGYGQTRMEFRVALPDGWHAQLPPSVDAASEFGHYRSEYAQHGRDLVLTRTITGATGVYAPDQATALVQWLNAIAKDDAKLIVITKPAPVP
jgi:transglutaminase-like putative cysteine protease